VKENKDIGRGMALGVWGASQATGAGVGIAVGGFARDLVNGLALSGDLGVAMNDVATGYLFVYHFEILLIFITIIFLGPLSQEINKQYRLNTIKRGNFGLAELPS
jgi:BCD family chlorophyll transporter-like MFS transporter